MPNPFVRLFSTRYMVRQSLRQGEVTPSGEAYRNALRISLPAIAEMISIALIGMADTAMVGRLGPYAVAAVGLTGQPRLIFLCVFYALNVGVTAIVSRRKGEGDQESARSCVRQALLLGLGLVAVMSVLSVAAAEPLMRLAGAKPDTLPASTEYFRILGMGLLFQALSLVICAAQRGVGNTRVTMTVNITANVVNVVFNYLLIEGNFGFPRLEVAGAAIATVIGNAVGFSLALRSLTRKDTYLRLTRKDSFRPDIPMLRGLTRLGGSSMIEQAAMRVGFFAYARIIAELGTNAFAAHQIAMQLMGLSFTFADGISVASTALVGQNLGRKRPDLAMMYGKIGQRFAFVVAVALGVASFLGRDFFPLLFTQDRGIVALTAEIIMILAFIQPFQTSQVVMGGSLRGAGDTRYVALTMLVTVMLVRPLASLVFIYGFQLGLAGAWYAILFDQTLRLAMLFTRFSRGKWAHIRV